MHRENDQAVDLTDKLIEEFLKRDLPTAAEQADNFILWLGDHSDAGTTLEIDPSTQYAIFGSLFRKGLIYIINGLKAASLLVNSSGTTVSGCLTFAGWSRYQELKRGKSQAKKAFMAMAFGNDELDRVYLRLKSAVAQTGFTLTRLDGAT